MKNCVFLLIVLLLLSCKDNSPVEQVATTEGKMSFSDEIDVTTNRTVNLMPEAREQVNTWLAYATAQDEIESLRNKTGSEIVGTSNSLMQIMESLKTSLPDTLSTPAVEARTTVLLTKSKLLHQLASKKNRNADEIFEVANDMIVEFDNFKLQINELFLKTPVDFENELDQEFQESMDQDSIVTEPLFSEEDLQ
jgi:methyltransferase-like protein